MSPVLQEAVSTGDPEMVQLVLQYRDYQRATRRLAGIPELLSKLRRVRPPKTAPCTPTPPQGHPPHCPALPGPQ